MRVLKACHVCFAIQIILLASYCHAQWTEPVRISSDPHLGHPRVAVVGDTLHVSAKRLTKLYYLRSFDNGETWTDPICPVDTFYYSYINDIAYSNGRLHIAFIGQVHIQDPIKLFTVSSRDHGWTWDEPREVYYIGWKYPQLATSGDTLFLSSAIPGYFLVFTSYDNGENWSEPSVVDSGTIDSPHNILYSQGRVHLIYELGLVDDTVGFEIYHSYSDFPRCKEPFPYSRFDVVRKGFLTTQGNCHSCVIEDPRRESRNPGVGRQGMDAGFVWTSPA